jgi:hypothetical protein
MKKQDKIFSLIFDMHPISKQDKFCVRCNHMETVCDCEQFSTEEKPIHKALVPALTCLVVGRQEACKRYHPSLALSMYPAANQKKGSIRLADGSPAPSSVSGSREGVY